MKPVIAILDRFRWPLAIAAATVIAIFGGSVMGDLASEPIAPFYANVVTPQVRPTPGEGLADVSSASYGDATGNIAISPVDLSYASATASAADDSAKPAQ